MRLRAALVALIGGVAIYSSAAAALAEGDPEGTAELEIAEGAAKVIPAPDGSRVICDDGAVAAAELADGKFQIRGIKVGTTLCGVRQPGEIPGGLYRVKVIGKRDEKPAAPATGEKTSPKS